MKREAMSEKRPKENAGSLESESMGEKREWAEEAGSREAFEDLCVRIAAEGVLFSVVGGKESGVGVQRRGAYTRDVKDRLMWEEGRPVYRRRYNRVPEETGEEAIATFIERAIR